ncbi:MAG TPA: glycosyltransferase [Myxococcota bacterium]|nr:glycosyltransferase [Myxococcota bacterium]
MAAELSPDVPFVVLASAVWDTTNPVNAHQIARRLAAAGHRVLFVDSSGLRAPALLASAHDRRRVLARLSRGLGGARAVAPNLWVRSPLTLPAGWPEPLRSLSQSLYAWAVRRAARRLGFERPVVWAMLPNQLGAARALAPRKLVYHAVDDYAANPGVDAAWVRAREHEMVAAADLVFAASPSLTERLRAQRPDVELLANVADVELFSRAVSTSHAEPPELARLRRPRAVYVGNLAAYRLDFELLRAAARALPGVELVLIGPIGLGERDPAGPAAALAAEPNVAFLGPRPQPDLPALLAHCDVALLPLLENAHTLSCMPLKLWEYLAAGLPVVARDLPNLRGLLDERAIRLYADPAGFVPALAKALEDAGRGRAERLKAAQTHGWPARIAEIRARLAESLA